MSLDFAEIADKLLEKSGFFNNFTCKRTDICKDFYDISKCSKDNCSLLKDIRNEEVPQKLLKKISNNALSVTGIKLTCPRSIQSRSKIIKRCVNASCHFYTPNLAFHCMLLHGKAFFPDEVIPRRVKEVGTALTDKQLSDYEIISVYLMRIYFILFKYGLENLKMEYRLDNFQTKYIYKFLECIGENIETCNICGAVIKSKPKKVKIANSLDYYIHNEYSCSCKNPEILKKRKEAISFWHTLLNNHDYPESSLSFPYKKFHRTLGKKFNKTQVMRFLLTNFNFDGLYLKQIPIGYVLRAYKVLFGKFIPANFGLTKKNGNLFINLFDEEQAA